MNQTEAKKHSKHKHKKSTRNIIRNTIPFHIKVYGRRHSTSPAPLDQPFKKSDMIEYLFRVVYDGLLYSVECKVDQHKVQCGTFNTLREAETTITHSMKLAMKGQYLAKKCYCDNVVYFPQVRCEKCHFHLSFLAWQPYYVVQTMHRNYDHLECITEDNHHAVEEAVDRDSFEEEYNMMTLSPP